MLSLAPLAQGLLYFLCSIVHAQTLPQSTTPGSQTRGHLTQDQLWCLGTNFVSPIYPKEARLARIEGVVQLNLVIAEDNSIAELQAVSGNPLLLESTIKAVRQWIFSMGGRVVGNPKETEIPLTFTFKIEDPPKPAYLHLKNGKVIRADSVREFTDRTEYTVGGRTHHIPPESVTDINACARVSLFIKPKGKGDDCIPASRPSFDIIAIPLLPADRFQ